MNLTKKYLVLSLILFVVLHLFTPVRGHAWDMYCWAEWSKYIFENGVGPIYKFWTDYLPLYHYFLWAFDLFQSSKEAVDANIHYLKLFPLLFHLLSGYVLILLLQQHRSVKYPLANSLFYLLNIAVLYNGLVWGQMDIVLTFFILISFYFAYLRQIVPSIFFLVVAINFKMQAIVFVPLLGLMLLPNMVAQFSWKRLLSWLFWPMLFQVLVLLPYYQAGTLGRLWEVVLGSFTKHESIAIDAYNFWHLVIPDLTVGAEDKSTFAGITYKHWGLCLFFVSSFFALWPLLKVTWQSLRERVYRSLSLNSMLLIFGLVPLLFFYFCTEMHERYAHPGLIFILAFSIRSGKPLPGLLASWAYFFNLERVLHFLQIHNYGTLVFHPMFISFIWLLCIVSLFLNLYEKAPNWSLHGFSPWVSVNLLIAPIMASFRKTAQRFHTLPAWKVYLPLALVTGGLIHLCTPATGHGWDSYCWINWASAMYTWGFSTVYSGWTEYLPLFQYFLKGYVMFQPNQEGIAENIQYFKLWSLLFHLLSGYLVYRFIQSHPGTKHPLLKTLFYLLNVAVLYNSMVWGQVDIILTYFVLLALYAAWRGQISLALLCFVAALSFKIQAIVFFPPLLLYVFPQMKQTFSWGRLLSWVFVPLGFLFLVLLPFIWVDDLVDIWKVITDSFTRFPYVSLNAFNFWHLVIPGLTDRHSDASLFMNLPLKSWGLLLFCASSFLALFPLLKTCYNSLFHRQTESLPLDRVLLIFALIPFLFFYFNTEMHERYSHPGLIFVIIYGIRSGNVFLPLLASFAYFFNLEAVMRVLHLSHYQSLLFNPTFVSWMWLITLVGLYLRLYGIKPSMYFFKTRNDRLIHSSTDI